MEGKGKCKGSAKLKVKTKSHRPIILLKRRSCGSARVKPSKKDSTMESTSHLETNVYEKLFSHKLEKDNEDVATKDLFQYSGNEAVNIVNEAIPEILQCDNDIKQECFENYSKDAWITSANTGSTSAYKPILDGAGAHEVGMAVTNPQGDQLCRMQHQNFCEDVEPVSLPAVSSQFENCIKQEAEPFYRETITGNHVRQIYNSRLFTTPVNNNSVSSYIPLTPDLPAIGDAHCGRFIFPAAHSRNNSSDIYLPPYRSHHCQPGLTPGFLTQGGVFQQVGHPGVLHYQNIPRQNVNHSVQLGSHETGIKWTNSMVDDSLTNITWLGRMGLDNFMPVALERGRKHSAEGNDKRGRPPYSYMALIQFAINSSCGGRMTLRQIYQWIEEKFPYFKTAKPGWKNSIRHNLSLHDIFVREVTNGSKASYWTIRSDLNMRPLTLDSVACSTSHEPLWSLQKCSQGQKPILPRLPHCSRPYVLFPVPLLQQPPNKGSSTTTSQKQSISECQGSGCCNTASSSILVDSGFISDISNYTSNSTDSHFQFNNSNVMKHEPSCDLSPLLSQCNVAGTSSHKRSRKEPLKALNDDSFNTSLQLCKVAKEPESSSILQSLSPSGEQFLLCKKQTKRPKTNKADITLRTSAIGLSDESFNELLNDLGSPFKTYLTHNKSSSFGSSPNQPSRKRRCSWGSPESSSSGADFQRKLREATENMPMTPHIRRVKSEAGNLSKDLDRSSNADHCALPTSTPLHEDKWKKSKHERDIAKAENKENELKYITPSEIKPWMTRVEGNDVRLVSPIPSSQIDSEFESDFFEDVIGSVFNTPDQPSEPICHFDRFTPERAPLSNLTSIENSGERTEKNYFNRSAKCALSEPEPLDTSFTKLLDISGGSGSLNRRNINFSEISDLNLSWSHLPPF